MRPAVVFATVFGLGRWPWGPGTLTSAAVTAALWLPGPPRPPVLAAAAALAAGLGCWVAHLAERELGHDAAAITVDEVAGVLVALAAAPRTAAGFALAFLLFRAFDVAKPPPLGALARLPGGAGVVADDLGAGFYAAATLLLLSLFGHRLPWVFGTS